MRGWAWLIVAACAADARAEAPPVPHAFGGIALTVWGARAEWETYAYTSPGIRALLGYRHEGALSVVGAVDYVIVDAKGSPVTYFSVAAGVRLHVVNESALEPYAEALVSWHYFDHDPRARSGLGVRVGVGVAVDIRHHVAVSAGIGLDYASLRGDEDSLDFTIIVGELGVGYRW